MWPCGRGNAGSVRCLGVNLNLVTSGNTVFEVVSHLHKTIFINWLTRSPAAGMFGCFLVAGIHYKLSLLLPQGSFIDGLVSDDNLTMAKNSWWNKDFIKLQSGEKHVYDNLSWYHIRYDWGYSSEWNERFGSLMQFS